MREKEVYLKKINNFFLIFLIFIFLLLNSFKLFAQENQEIKEVVFQYFDNISEFSSLFLQTNNEDLSEGKLFYMDNRLRVDYTSPSNILIIISEKKAMYYNKDLNEVEYFNPKKSIAKIFFNIFNEKKYFNDAKFSYQKNYIQLQKEIFIDEYEKFNLIITFEKNPTLLRNVKIYNQRIFVRCLNMKSPYIIKRFVTK